MSQPPPEILVAQQRLLEEAQRKTNEEIQRKLELLGKQVAAAQAQQQAEALMKQVQRKQQEELKAQQQMLLQKRKTPYRKPAVEKNPKIDEKFEDLFAVIGELGKDVNPTYGGSKSAKDRLTRGIQHARQLVRECLWESDKICDVQLKTLP
ncbi:Oidioi.mRNA.OKI2018_I69.chr2.g4335.t1.cds [Oikopleura dioica]|uniref:Oidioi.mRNA.OKI2018_I69.chr2.g4335.t1.cds n=1 Tax=Oikopleura dioica TaxID=34765 RepID=A0ABN7T199_OIKDI|nr:Oidioi.mRNA.OKI2018_I69.chr2.g4335.t1.cds [Oikopleura dioica]